MIITTLMAKWFMNETIITKYVLKGVPVLA